MEFPFSEIPGSRRKLPSSAGNNPYRPSANRPYRRKRARRGRAPESSRRRAGFCGVFSSATGRGNKYAARRQNAVAVDIAKNKTDSMRTPRRFVNPARRPFRSSFWLRPRRRSTPMKFVSGCRRAYSTRNEASPQPVRFPAAGDF